MKENMRDFSVLKQRILQYLDFKGITKYECYKNTGITNGVLSQPNGMSEDNLLKFLSYYSDISTDWLLAGCGSMLRDDNQTKISKIVPIESEFESIPIVDISVAAGYGCENPDFIEVVETIRLPYNMLRRNRKYFCVKVRGESMSPTLLDCSFLILRLLDRSEWNEIKDNHVYVVSDRSGRAYVKRIKNRFREHGFIVCTSDNVDKANYPNFNLMEDEINTILYVEWYLSAKMPNINETYYDKVNHLEDDVDALKSQMSLLMKRLT